MKRFRHCLVVLAAFLMAVTAWAEQGKTEPILRLAVDLVDGSHIIGVPSSNTVPLQTSYAKMDIPLKQVASIVIEADHESASLELRNGDKLTGVLSVGQLRLSTVFGAVSIGIEHVQKIHVVPGERMLQGLREDLILHFGFDKDEERVKDKSGNGHDALVHGSSWTREGKVGSGRQFVRSRGDYLDCGNILGGHKQLTLSVWLRTSYKGDRQYVLGKYNGGGDEAEDSFLFRINEQRPVFQFSFGGEVPGQWASILDAQGVTIADGQWHHYAAVLDAATDVHTAYVDGQQYAAIEKPIEALNKGTRNLLVGGSEEYGRGVHFFDGTLDEVMIFNRAMTAQEVKLLYESQK